jgi:hypothetical protein
MPVKCKCGHDMPWPPSRCDSCGLDNAPSHYWVSSGCSHVVAVGGGGGVLGGGSTVSHGTGGKPFVVISNSGGTGGTLLAPAASPSLWQRVLARVKGRT